MSPELANLAYTDSSIIAAPSKTALCGFTSSKIIFIVFCWIPAIPEHVIRFQGGEFYTVVLICRTSFLLYTIIFPILNNKFILKISLEGTVVVTLIDSP